MKSALILMFLSSLCFGKSERSDETAVHSGEKLNNCLKLSYILSIYKIFIKSLNKGVNVTCFTTILVTRPQRRHLKCYHNYLMKVVAIAWSTWTFFIFFRYANTNAGEENVNETTKKMFESTFKCYIYFHCIHFQTWCYHKLLQFRVETTVTKSSSE